MACAAILAGASATAVAAEHASAVTPATIASAAGCSNCHALDHKVLGPSYQDIAARYSGDADAAAEVAARLRHGSRGVWGPLGMQSVTATELSDADLAAIVAWILSQ